MNRDYYLTLELSNTKIRFLLGNVINNVPYVIDLKEFNNDFIKNNEITSKENLGKLIANSLKDFISDNREVISTYPKSINVVIEPKHLLSLVKKYTSNTVSSTNVIAHIDTKNLLSGISKIKLLDETQKIYDVIPLNYYIDDKIFLTEPLGETAKEISMEAMILADNEEYLNEIEEVLKIASLQIDKLILSSYSASLFLQNQKNISSSYVLLDLGADKTSISYIINGRVVKSSLNINYGGNNITGNIAKRFEISEARANELKEAYGLIKPPKFDVEITKGITLEKLTGVIEDSLDELGSLINDKINEITLNSSDLDLILIGGSSKLNNINRYLQKKLGLNVMKPDFNVIGARDPSLAAILGSLIYSSMQFEVNEEEITSTISREEIKKPTISKNEEIL